MRAVFDSNIVLSTLVFKGRQAWLRTAWAERRIRKVVSAETIGELTRVLAYPKFRLQPDRAGDVLAEYLDGAEQVAPNAGARGVAEQCRDPKDRMFIAAAVTAGVPIVTGDGDLLVLAGSLPVPVLTLAAYRVLLED